MKVKPLKWRRELNGAGKVCYCATGVRRAFTVCAEKTSYGDYFCRQVEVGSGMPMGQLAAPTVAKLKAKSQQLNDSDVMAVLKEWTEGGRDA